jgi:hypothetical protein
MATLEQSEHKEDALKVFGALIQGYAQACLNLNIVAGKQATETFTDIDVMNWYPLSKWTELEKMVVQSYEKANAIMVRVGIEMMTAWYNYGPGKELIKNGVDFLHYQTGSQGYESVVQGPRELVGAFELTSFEPEKGKALIQSTTPFNRKMECGVLIGGLSAPGDLDYVEVTNYNNPDYLEIEFH